ncbi:hypothetical protein PTNB73_08933 [Pyrenophora teres f. teres]|nr:hypothetical protein PTNB85_08533 [Pyrenophora teres f. teres]KAE8855030.1 hypothetical protein PTNB29_09281 [Pyrenophora teres f. teres]KAE8857685.1 hypothetical protein PTNB73_08933 [Pyrenophora teres f. teres]
MADMEHDGAATASHDATRSIAQAISKALRHPTYACGGTIKAAYETRNTSASSLEKLLKGTTPATFGFQGRDVIDESYRKASKLDATQFSTDFCPYEVGIVDVVAQALLPKWPGDFQGIRAQLYKLNVYQAPSGLLKPHVDTPRSDLQFGSLVACLPCEHQGGQLVVRHQGLCMTFDWAGPAKDIQWAAFYSDCEHEVLEVTSGHRITLTYNLYVRRGLGELTGHTNAMDVQQLPLYQQVKAALEDPSFFPEGDMVAFEVFRFLGIAPRVRPVLDLDEDTRDWLGHL